MHRGGKVRQTRENPQQSQKHGPGRKERKPPEPGLGGCLGLPRGGNVRGSGQLPQSAPAPAGAGTYSQSIAGLIMGRLHFSHAEPETGSGLEQECPRFRQVKVRRVGHVRRPVGGRPRQKNQSASRAPSALGPTLG